MGSNFSILLPQNIAAREVCVENSSGFFGFVFELRVEGCSTASITWPNTGCIDLRNCNNPREGDILHPTFDVLTGGEASRPVRYSDFGPRITLTCTGTTGDATCDGVRIEQRDLPNDSCMGGFCYVVVNQNRDRDSAQAYCNQKGGSLTSIANQEENEFIQTIANRSYQQDITIGGVVSGIPGRGDDLTESWLDGTPFDYTNWAPGEPNRKFFGDLDDGPTGREDTVEFRPNGEWNDILSTRHPQPFVCKIPMDVARHNAPYN